MQPNIIMVDVPHGYVYRFPKAFTFKDDGSETIEEWFIRNGYPEFLIEAGNLRYIQFFEVPLEDSRYLT